MSLPALTLTAAGKTAIQAALDAESLDYTPALFVIKPRRDPIRLDIAVVKDDAGAPGRRVSRGIPVIVDAGADGLPNHEIGASGGRYDLRPA